MRKIVALAAAVASLPSYATAQNLTTPNVTTGFYGEVGVGLSIIDDAKTDPFSLDVGVGILAGTMDTKYPSPTGTFGGEVGFATSRWRFGVSWDWMEANIDKAAFSGTISGAPINITFADTYLDSVGIETNSAFMIAEGNIYYKFSRPGSAVEPYIGIGAGAAFIQNASTELAVSASAGARFAITRRAYVGARYRFTYISGPESDDGIIKYENVLIHSLSVQLGMYFGS